MQQFAGNDLQFAIALLYMMECDWRNARHSGDHLAATLLNSEVLATPQQRETLEKNLREVERRFSDIGLPTSAITVREFRAELLAWKIISLERMSASLIVSKVQEIQNTMRREMATMVFMNVSSEHSVWINQPCKDWDEAITRWPRIKIDVEESSYCFALERYAAAVFHVMLVAEFGVMEVASAFNVAGDKPGWAALERIDRIRNTPWKDKSDYQKQYSKLLNDLSPFMLAMKSNWRHKLTHANNKLEWIDTDFSPQVAKDIISTIRAYMLCLARDLPQHP